MLKFLCKNINSLFDTFFEFFPGRVEFSARTGFRAEFKIWAEFQVQNQIFLRVEKTRVFKTRVAEPWSRLWTSELVQAYISNLDFKVRSFVTPTTIVI